MRILYIDNGEWWGGAESSLKEYLHDQTAIGWKAKICAPFPMEHHQYYGIDSSRIVYRNSRKLFLSEKFSSIKGVGRLKSIISAIQLWGILKAEKPDIVHFNLLRGRDYLDIWLARKAGCKVVLHLRSLYHQCRYSKELLDLGDLVIGVSDWVCNEARQTGTTSKIVRIYDGVKNNPRVRLGREKARNSLGISESQVVGVFPAVLEPRKGQDVALRAFCELVEQYPESILIIVGPCPEDFEEYKCRLEQMARSIKKNVKFLGYQKEMDFLYSIADYVLALSRDGEAFGRIPVEAGQAGLPVIATRAGATQELVVDQITGILVTPGSVSETVDAIRSMQDHLKRESLGKAAIHRTSTIFDLDECQRQLRDAILSLKPDVAYKEQS